MNLKPNMYKKNIFDINYDKLKENNIKYLFFDLDNTIIPYTEDVPDQKIIDLFENLKKDFTCFLFSNSLSKRVINVKNILNIDIYYNSMKPLKKNYIKVMKKYDYTKCAFIGDQIMTDVLGAKRNNMYIILVDRLDKKEPITTKFWRLLERIVLNHMRKKNLFIKGNYYE